MKRILILRGISGSGKSTFAAKLASEGYYIVSRDQIRLDLLGKDGLETYFSNGMDPYLEEYITKIEEREIVGHIAKDHKLIIDDTHTKRVYVQALVNLFYEMKIDPERVEIIQFDISFEEARKRCDKRDKKPISDEVLQRQIVAMEDKFSIRDFTIAGVEWFPKPISRHGKITEGFYEPRKWFVPDFETKPYVPNPKLPKAVIVDLDGTSAHRVVQIDPIPHMRSYYSYKEVDRDVPDLLTSAIIQGLMSMNVEPVFLSGRKSHDVEDGEEIDVRKLTIKYIEEKLHVSNPVLFMRNPDKDVDENGRDLKDDRVKHRILHEEVAPLFQVIGALDDRARVCSVWEDIGIKCLNCATINEIGRY